MKNSIRFFNRYVFVYDQRTNRGSSLTLAELVNPAVPRLGMNVQAHATPPKDQYLIWNPKDTQENTPNWQKRTSKPDQWTRALRNTQTGYNQPWRGTSENAFFEWLVKEANNPEELSFIRKFFVDLDLTALLVFADWLQEHDDPRELLVREAVKNKLRPGRTTPQKENIIKQFGIHSVHPSKIDYSDSTAVQVWIDTEISYDERKNKFFRLEGKNLITIDPDQVPDDTIKTFFWALISRGFMI